MSIDEIGPAHPGHVTPEDVAATAPDEADAAYSINPAPDPGEEPEDEGDPDPNCTTVFLVVIGVDGTAFTTSEVDKIGELVPAREATIPDMRRACQEVVHDINAMQASQQAAVATAQFMEQRAKEMAEQSQQERMAQALMKKGITVPKGARR